MEEIKELNRGHVHIRDREYVMNTLMKMISDGPDKLQWCRMVRRNAVHRNHNSRSMVKVTGTCRVETVLLSNWGTISPRAFELHRMIALLEFFRLHCVQSYNLNKDTKQPRPVHFRHTISRWVVADFDRTLSKYTHRGNVCATCHNVLEEGGLSEEYKEKALQIRDKYFPIETDPNMTIEEKIPYMIQWWTQAHDLLLKYPLSKEMLHKMVANSTATLRDGCTDFFDKLHSCDIPLLIFSAGVGDIIREIISQHSTFYNNMHVVSNDLDFDETGRMIGFKGEIIHVFNKNENAVHDSDYFTNLSHCTNILLMGDSLGDLQMANGADNVEAKLTIGFLNTRVADSLELYKSKYDIVICEDETLDIVNAIVNRIVATG